MDDLLVVSTSDSSLESLESHMRKVYKDIKIGKGKVLYYIGMTIDCVVPGQVCITMDNCERDILSGCGVWELR